jgi:hypothetical protein
MRANVFVAFALASTLTADSQLARGRAVRGCRLQRRAAENPVNKSQPDGIAAARLAAAFDPNL